MVGALLVVGGSSVTGAVASRAGDEGFGVLLLGGEEGKAALTTTRTPHPSGASSCAVALAKELLGSALWSTNELRFWESLFRFPKFPCYGCSSSGPASYCSSGLLRLQACGYVLNSISYFCAVV